MHLSQVSLFATLSVFVSILYPGHSLECYTCDANATSLTADPCKTIEALRKCQDPAVCLSAIYLYEDKSAGIKQYTSIKSCYQSMSGQECDNYLKTLKTTIPMSASVEFAEKCHTCGETGCTKSGSSRILPAIFVCLFGYILSSAI